MKTIYRGLSLLFYILLILLSACSPQQSQAHAEDTLPLEACFLTQESVPLQVEAQCGTLTVPEDPASPSGKQINLRVAVIPAKSRTPAADPLFLLAGGPGQAATEAYLALISDLYRANFKRDLVMVDQRGSGNSNPLVCPDTLNDQFLPGEIPDLESFRQWAARCRANLNADLRFYSSLDAIRDLEAARQALGFGQINLLGVSYGTRTAQLYQQTYPENVRSMILDGVVPAGWHIGETVIEDSQRSLDLLFARCAREEGCSQTFPDIANEFNALLEDLEKEPRQVSLPHPLTGQKTTMILTAEGVSSTIRVMSYSDLTTTLIPLVIHQAQSEGDMLPLAAQYLITTESIGKSLYDGLYYAVMCSEDIPFYPAEHPVDAGYLRVNDEYIQILCEEWAIPPKPDATRLPPTSDVPTLIISGEVDPITPPENGEMAAFYLPNSLHLIIPEMGHNNFAKGCMPRIVRDFLEAGSVQNLDSTCIDQIAAMPFFIHPAGPRP
jgi:pimeloyl-ACP methyl ester carboxylesterase